MGLIDEVRTGTLVLEPLRAGHADAAAVLFNSAELHRYIGGSPRTVDELRARYARLERGSGSADVVWANWLIRDTPSGDLVGTIQATIEPGERRATLAWVVGVAVQGRGIAGAGAAAVRDHLVANGIRRFRALIHPDNHASARVAAGLGMLRSGEWEDGEEIWASTVRGSEVDAGRNPAAGTEAPAAASPRR